MKKTFLFVTIFLLSCSIQGSAQIQINVLDQLGSEAGKVDTVGKEVLDQAKYRVYYTLSFLEDTTDVRNQRECQTLLQIGSKYTAFLDYNSLRRDSIIDLLASKSVDMEETISSLLPVQKLIGFEPTIIKNYPERGKSVFQQSVSANKYRYTDHVQIEWNLEEGEKEIQGYACNKAMCNYRGRDYVAWYAPTIPITDGPYIFSGLPGLIMEIADTNDHYHFSLVGLTAIDYDDPIYLQTGRVNEVSRKDVRKMIHNIKTDPASLLKSVTASGTNVKIKINGSDESMDDIMAKMEKKPYNPIELE